jgi:hypothetical protein
MPSIQDRPRLNPFCPPLSKSTYHTYGKAIPVTGRGGSLGCETSRLPHFPDNQLTDGGEVVSLTRWSPFTPQEVSWY